MAAVAGLSFTIGLTFAAAGAWPILGFFGLDVALVYFAFRFNYRAGRLVETIRLTRSALLIRRIHPGGRIEEWSLPALLAACCGRSDERGSCRALGRNSACQSRPKNQFRSLSD
jgi:uncharacterized membrane protein